MVAATLCLRDALSEASGCTRNSTMSITAPFIRPAPEHDPGLVLQVKVEPGVSFFIEPGFGRCKNQGGVCRDHQLNGFWSAKLSHRPGQGTQDGSLPSGMQVALHLVHQQHDAVARWFAQLFGCQTVFTPCQRENVGQRDDTPNRPCARRSPSPAATAFRGPPPTLDPLLHTEPRTRMRCSSPAHETR